MPTRFLHAALVGKYQASGIRPVLEEIALFLKRSGLQVSLEKGTATDTGLTAYPALDVAELGERCDIAVVLGGDGTMLSIAREMSRYGVPLVGINAGRLGFITDLPQAGFQETLGPIIAGDYEEERRTMLEGTVCRAGVNLFEGFAMNDVVVSRGATVSMVELRLSVDSEFVANWRADGLIVSSPTGSTAYALSAGGPILHPGIQGWVLVPIAPHALSNRPIVLPDSGQITIEIVGGRDATANFDMHSITSLQLGDIINVQRSPNQVRFLHPRGWSYYATLRRKLHWTEGVA